MSENQRLFIFHIFRNDGTSLFLHPFGRPERIVRQLESCTLEGRYGREPRVEALTLLRNELYRRIELGVKSWLSDVRFIPKFLLASLVFVVTYFFMSYVVRDPVPVIDEVAIGLAAAVVVFVLQGRRDAASKAAMKKRVDLRVVVDRVVFRESDFVKLVEEALHRNEGGSGEEVVRGIVEPVQQELGDQYREEAAQFIRSLEGRFDLRRLAREEKYLRRLLRRTAPGAGFTRLVEQKKYDFPLYAVYKSLKKTVASAKH
jgi:hypothetical protein